MTVTELPDHHANRTPAEHRDAMYEAFTRLAQDCVDLGLRPTGVAVSSLFGSVDIRIQFSGTDTDAVDRLAECNGFDPDDASPQSSVFSRSGQLVIGDQLVKVLVFTGRPEATEVAA